MTPPDIMERAREAASAALEEYLQRTGRFPWREIDARLFGTREAEERVMDWQPIETAPKDGTDILVWGSIEMSSRSRPHVGTEDIIRVCWSQGGESWVVTSVQADGWVPEPTHWMPLPAPPA